LARNKQRAVATSDVPRADIKGPAGGNGDASAPCEELYTLLNSLAHEIRNPLNALAVNLNLLAREIGEGPGAAKLAAALKEIRRLDDLLTAFLRFARPKEAKPRELNLGRLLRELETFIAPVAAKDGVTLDFSEIADVVVRTDGDLLKQALLNVLLNSFEAGAGRVAVSAVTEGDDVVISVRDDGPGFAEPSRAFAAFYSTKAEGSGLGLATSRALAASLGGKLSLGQPPAGAEIVLTIPKMIPGSGHVQTSGGSG
jgi:two-component system sensor histidine kinase HydH